MLRVYTSRQPPGLWFGISVSDDEWRFMKNHVWAIPGGRSSSVPVVQRRISSPRGNCRQPNTHYCWLGYTWWWPLLLQDLQQRWSHKNQRIRDSRLKSVRSPLLYIKISISEDNRRFLDYIQLIRAARYVQTKGNTQRIYIFALVNSLIYLCASW